jgi:hypothetical protein
VSGSRAILSVFVISQREMSTYEQLMRKRAQQAAQARARTESLSAKGGGKTKKRRVAALAQADNDVADGAIMLGALSVGGMLRVRLYVPAESTTHRIFLGARESLELLGNLQAPTRLWMPRLMQRLRLRQPLARAIASGRDGGRARTIMTRFMHKRIVKVPRFDFDLDDASNERRGATRRLAIEVLSEVPLTPPPFRSLAAAHAGQQLLANVDAALHTALASRFSIESFPTLVLFRQGQPHDFEASTETSQTIVDAMAEQLGTTFFQSSSGLFFFTNLVK